MDMRLSALAAAAALCVSSFCARADTANANFTTGTYSFVNTSGSQSNPLTMPGFNSAAGTLNSVSLSLSGQYSSNNVGSSNASLSGYVSTLPFSGTAITGTTTVTENPGNFLYTFSNSVLNDTDAAVLKFFTGSAVVNPYFNLTQTGPAYTTIGPLRGTVTYNYTPSVVVTPAATPEPSSFALLGTGILGIAGAVRRRIVS